MPGVNGPVYAMVVFDDGSGPALYVGGDFSVAGGIAANRIAKWNGSNWLPLSSGIDGSNGRAVRALSVFDDGTGPALFAAGEFTLAGGLATNFIAKWDGTSWSPLGSGSSGRIYSLAVFDDGSGPALYAGGDFWLAGGVEVNNIAKWNGASWSALGDGLYGDVLALIVSSVGGAPALYVGGEFSGTGFVSTPGIAKWDGSTWAPLGIGLDGEFSPRVSALTVFDDGSGPALYAGGEFDAAGGVAASNVAKWDGSNWSPLGNGINSTALSFSVFDDGYGSALHVGGIFTDAGGMPASHVAKWDGNTWAPLGSGTDNRVPTLAVFDDGNGPALYAGGYFFTAGGAGVNGIAKWNGSTWSAVPPGAGMSGPSATASNVKALAVFDDGSGPALFAGGEFTTAGGVATTHIAAWNGTSWATFGGLTGPNGAFVSTLRVFDDGSGPALFAGGVFGEVGGVPANSIAKWNGSSWSPLGSGIGGALGRISALTAFDDGTGPALYAGGQFASAGGVPARGIAKWDGSNWSPLGSGISGGPVPSVSALAVFDDGTGPALYVGGYFTTAGGLTVNSIAKWDGSSWSPLGTGVSALPVVWVLTVFDDGSGPALYAGGSFTVAGGVAASYVAKWNGSAWTPVGSGLNSAALALTIFNDGGGPALYAGGYFTLAGGIHANRIAKWSGGSWSPLGIGMGGTLQPIVAALAVFDDGSGPALFAGGGFGTAGGVPSSFIAKWTGCAPANCLGDTDCNGAVDFFDIDSFVAKLGCPALGETCNAGCPWQNGDVDQDGDVDFFDIDPFVARFGAVCP